MDVLVACKTSSELARMGPLEAEDPHPEAAFAGQSCLLGQGGQAMPPRSCEQCFVVCARARGKILEHVTFGPNPLAKLETRFCQRYNDFGLRREPSRCHRTHAPWLEIPQVFGLVSWLHIAANCARWNAGGWEFTSDPLASGLVGTVCR